MRKIFAIKTAIILCLLGSGLTIVAQDNKPLENEQDKKYMPDPSSIFNNMNKKKEYGGNSDVTIKNNIKFCPTMVARQKITFFYEREVTSGLTLNLGVGQAFGNDIFQNAFLQIKSFTSEDELLSPSDLLDNAKFDRSLPLLNLGARFYVSGKTFDEDFIELFYRYERTDYLLNSTINGYRIDGSNRATFSMNSFMFGYGYTAVVGDKNNIIHEFFVNFGAKFFSYTQFDAAQLLYPNSSSGVQVYQRSDMKQKVRILPAFNIGYCFGFGF